MPKNFDAIRSTLECLVSNERKNIDPVESEPIMDALNAGIEESTNFENIFKILAEHPDDKFLIFCEWYVCFWMQSRLATSLLMDAL